MKLNYTQSCLQHLCKFTTPILILIITLSYDAKADTLHYTKKVSLKNQYYLSQSKLSLNTNKLVSVDFVKIPIKVLLTALISDNTNLSPKFHPSVNGNISINMKANWFEVFFVILKKYRLAFRKQEKDIFVAPVSYILK
jgi:hypothetical protein